MRNGWKPLFLMILILALLFCFAACAGQEQPPAGDSQAGQLGEAETPAEETSAEAGTVYPLTLMDQAGREVTLAAEPERIVSGYYISSSACIALGLTDRLAGIEAKADTRNIYALSAPQLLELPNVGSAKEFDLEGCIALEPDLVILPKKLADAAETMTGLGIPVMLVNPESHEELTAMINLLATATNTQAKADALISYYEQALLEVNGLIAAAEKPRVYMAGNSAYLSTAPKDMYQGALIESVGAINAAAEIDGNSWTDISYEQLLALNPDIIIIPSEASYTADDIRNDSQLSLVTAVAGNAIYQMPTAFEPWDSPTPSGILGLKWLLSVVHPDLYTLEQVQEDVVSFYADFYGFQADPAQVGK